MNIHTEQDPSVPGSAEHPTINPFDMLESRVSIPFLGYLERSIIDYLGNQRSRYYGRCESAVKGT